MKGINIEEWKRLFDQQKLHLSLGIIKKLDLAKDRSMLQVVVSLFPENLECVARMTWELVGPDAGVFGFPVPNDLVLLGFVDDDEDQCFVLKRLTSRADKIPLQAVDGSTVIRALSGKKTHLLSDTAILLGRGGADPTQPLVLGTVFKTAYSTDLDETAKHKHIGNLGFYTTVPDNAAQFTTLKASPVDNGNMLSDIAKTEK